MPSNIPPDVQAALDDVLPALSALGVHGAFTFLVDADRVIVGFNNGTDGFARVLNTRIEGE